MKILVKGGGMYGCAIADRLRHDHEVYLYDPAGLLTGASFKNFRRLHHGYHYPDNPEPYRRAYRAFLDRYGGKFCRPVQIIYSIADEGEWDPHDYAAALRRARLPHRIVRTKREVTIAEWGAEGIEAIYDVAAARAHFARKLNLVSAEPDCELVIDATYLNSPLAKRLKKKKTRTYHMTGDFKWGRTCLMGPYGGFIPCAEGGAIAYHAGTNNTKKALADLKRWYTELGSSDVIEVRDATILHPKEGGERPYFLDAAPGRISVVGGKVADSVRCADQIAEMLR